MTDLGKPSLKKIRFYEKLSQRGGGGLLVFILLFRNLKAQNGIFWARIGCFDVSKMTNMRFIASILLNI